MVHFFSIFTLMTLVHTLITIGVSYRVIKVRLPVATSLAWLILVFFLPLLGAIAYLVLGEKRLGRKFTARSRPLVIVMMPGCKIYRRKFVATLSG
jgi:hypothetical protein